MSDDLKIYNQPLLSESSLDRDSDLTISEEKTAYGDAYQQKAIRDRRTRAGMLTASMILNFVLLISLASLFARFHRRVEWKGAPQLWSKPFLPTSSPLS